MIKKIIIYTLIAAIWMTCRGSSLQNYKINQILFKNAPPSTLAVNDSQAQKYLLLLAFTKGQSFSYKKNRESMENLYKTGLFSNITSEVELLKNNRLNVLYTLSYQFIIRGIKIKTSAGIDRKALRDSIFSLRKNTVFQAGALSKATKDIENFMNSRGYFNPVIRSRTVKDEKEFRITIYFDITPGVRTAVRKVNVSISRKEFLHHVAALLEATHFIPAEYNRKMERVRRFLKSKNYYFPTVTLKETFTDQTKTAVDLQVDVKPGNAYEFNFSGIEDKSKLIAPVWEKKVFEKWAEKESKARLQYYLTNKGYLNSSIDCQTKVENNRKYISFTVQKNQKYKLGNISFSGNTYFNNQELGEIIKSDDMFTQKFFNVSTQALRADQEVLRLFYYYKGFPSAIIALEPTFREKKADIAFVIDEGQKVTVDTLLFTGNKQFQSNLLARQIKTVEKGPFVPQIVNEDVERLLNFYRSNGFDGVAITPEISPGIAKSIMFNITEGPRSQLGNLVIVGASSQQQQLLKRLFPLKKGDYYDRIKIEAFRIEIENSSVFNEIKIVQISKPGHRFDVLVNVVPENSNYYGFGIGWKEREGLRGTLEYQERNIFKGYSSLSTIVQGGKNVQRGIISYDTPYFFKHKINSELRLWMDDEIYPTYHLNRLGLRESLIKKLTANAYILTALSIYRTELSELEIAPNFIDLLDIPFYTGAFNVSYVLENRDNPFNPTLGDFFSSDIKAGVYRYYRNDTARDQVEAGLLPDELFERNNYFLKLRWSYQKNLSFLKSGSLALTFKNGLAFGDLSITDRFFAGGVNSFRGVKNDRLGPFDVFIESTDPSLTKEWVNNPRFIRKPKGGNMMLIMNLEATFPLPLVKSNDFYYAVFADVGNVYSRVRDFDLGQLKKAVGFSLKIKTQLGPLRFDVAWLLGKRGFFNGSKESNFAWHVGFGNVL